VALAAVAAPITIIGIFAKPTGANSAISWERLLVLFLDSSLESISGTTNRLLGEAVAALLSLEKKSEDKLCVRHIEMSTKD
jgi:hypothetical protein